MRLNYLVGKKKTSTILKAVEALKGFIFPKRVVFQTLLSFLAHSRRAY